MPDMDKLLQAIDAAEANAYGSEEDGDLAGDRELAIRLYLGKDVDPAPAGRSSVIDRSVFECIQWILPSLLRIFASGDDIVEFVPQGPEDEEQAKQEGDYLNFQVTQKNPWFNICNTWFTDALTTKNAYCWAYMDRARHVETERYEAQSQEGIALLLQSGDAQIVEAGPSAQGMTPEGLPLYDLVIRRTREKPNLTFQVLPPERCRVAHTTPDHTLRRADYFEYWDYQSISHLRSLGFDVPDDIGDGDAIDTLEDDARDLYEEEIGSGDDVRGRLSPEMRRVKVRHIWIRCDYDGDGIAELQYVLRVGRQILQREEASRIPVSCIVPTPLPHRHMGLSIADMVADIQRIKTALLRSALDNVYFANNPAIAFDKNTVNLDDLLISRPGQRIRVDGSPGASFLPVATPFVLPQVIEALGFMEQVTEGRTGVNRYFQGSDQNTLNKTASGIQQLSTMAAQRVEQIARVFAAGIEELFSIAHELVLKSGHQKEVVRLRNQWVTVDPSTWRSRSDMRISVGFAAGNKDAMVSRLMMIAQLQEKAAAGGVPIVGPQNLYQTAIELTKAADFSAPQRFWTDPATVPPPPPPQPDVTVVAAEQIRAQSLLQKAQIDNQTKLQIAAADQQTEVAKLQMQPAIEREKAVIRAEGAQAAAVIGAQTKVALAAAEPPEAPEAPDEGMDEEVRAFMRSQAEQTATLLAAIRELAAAVRKPA